METTRAYYERIMREYNQNRNGRSLKRYCQEEGINYQWITEYRKANSMSARPQEPEGQLQELTVVEDRFAEPASPRSGAWKVAALVLEGPSGLPQRLAPLHPHGSVSL